MWLNLINPQNLLLNTGWPNSLHISLPFIESSFEKCFPLKSVGEFSPSLSCQFREAQVPSESAMQNPPLPPTPPLPLHLRILRGKTEKPTVPYTARESNLNVLCIPRNRNCAASIFAKQNYM
jgi:hypothetical protein